MAPLAAVLLGGVIYEFSNPGLSSSPACLSELDSLSPTMRSPMQMYIFATNCSMMLLSLLKVMPAIRYSIPLNQSVIRSGALSAQMY